MYYLVIALNKALTRGKDKCYLPLIYRVTNLQDLRLSLLRLGIGLCIRLQMKK